MLTLGTPRAGAIRALVVGAWTLLGSRHMLVNADPPEPVST